MRLVTLPMAGGGGRPVLVNPEHVVCIVDLGEKRCQVVTSGLSGEASMSLLVELSPMEVAMRLGSTPCRETAARASA